MEMYLSWHYCFEQLNLDGHYNTQQLFELAVPSFEGEVQFWEGTGDSARTGFSKSVIRQSYLYENDNLLQENDLGKSYGMDNQILLDRITDSSTGEVNQLFLDRTNSQDLIVIELRPDNSSVEHSISQVGNKISFVIF